MRVHNSSSSVTRVPWSCDEATLQRFAASAALPAGAPVDAPALEFPDALEARSLSYQWMLGPVVLVAPVVTEGATTKDVWFPSGCWQSEGTGTTYDGPRPVAVPALLSVLGARPTGVASSRALPATGAVFPVALGGLALTAARILCRRQSQGR